MNTDSKDTKLNQERKSNIISWVNVQYNSLLGLGVRTRFSSWVPQCSAMVGLKISWSVGIAVTLSKGHGSDVVLLLGNF